MTRRRHLKTGTSEYNSWAHIMRRTSSSAKPRDRKNYYDRNIKVCQRWRDGEGEMSGFECFLHDMGEKPMPGYSIDRIDNDGDYEPNNCRWASPRQQSQNQRSNVKVTYRGKTYILADAIREFATVKYGTVYKRIREGWPVERALFSSRK